jgi:hypothetical protein
LRQLLSCYVKKNPNKPTLTKLAKVTHCNLSSSNNWLLQVINALSSITLEIQRAPEKILCPVAQKFLYTF